MLHFNKHTKAACLHICSQAAADLCEANYTKLSLITFFLERKYKVSLAFFEKKAEQKSYDGGISLARDYALLRWNEAIRIPLRYLLKGSFPSGKLMLLKMKSLRRFEA